MATSALTPQNYFSTTLSSSCTNTDTTIYLASLPTGNEGYLEIGEGLSTKEIIYYTSKGANFVTLPNVGAGRGVGGTSAAAHTSGEIVKQKLNAEWWLALQNGSAFKTTALSPVNTTNPYKFSAYRSAAWTDGNGGYTKISFDAKEYDTGSNFDIVTNVGRFTAPVAGFYQFQACAAASVTASNFFGIALYKNGTVIKSGLSVASAVTTGQAKMPVSALLSLAVNDYVEVYSFGTGGAGTTGASNTYFSGFMVSAT